MVNAGFAGKIIAIPDNRGEMPTPAVRPGPPHRANSGTGGPPVALVCAGAMPGG